MTLHGLVVRIDRNNVNVKVCCAIPTMVGHPNSRKGKQGSKILAALTGSKSTKKHIALVTV